MDRKETVKHFYEELDNAHSYLSVLTHKDKYDEDTYAVAVSAILEMVAGPSLPILVMALVESHTELKNRLFNDGIMKVNVGECCDSSDEQKTH
jgi:hypothetical protein